MTGNIQWLDANALAADRIDWSNPAVIAACIALLGALCGAAFGAVVAFWVRKRSEEESINRAVLAEINRLLVVLKRHEAFWRGRIAANDTGHVLIPFTHVVYTRQVPNVGLLKSELVADVVQFYGYVDFLNGLQASRREYITAGKSGDFDNLYLQSLCNCIKLGESSFDEQFRKLKIPTFAF